MIKLKDLILENESNPFKFRINKEEENHAVNFIITKLIPDVVKSFNKHIYPKEWYKPVTIEETVRNLRKIKHKRGKDMPFSYDRDEIKYASKTNYKSPFIFHIHKSISSWDRHPDGTLLAGYQWPGDNMMPQMIPVV